ncbi:glycoside hydrolase family 18, catalytic domain-containing protein [Artemisia annua]|uniref:Glycoside hydrolase family 18, catalytic domain-containing protein n=1 Tax=Artemisia annua TaxID=35608 RepID=A0A2U1MKC8_ARTAN|nr:glycoside hydrolase family 18, catalytic domain-containing protein [Artemisia annua]
MSHPSLSIKFGWKWRYNTSLGLKSISLSPIERVSICSPKGKLISKFLSPETSRQGKGGVYASAEQIITFADISEATNCFSEENKLGEGGYGPVYKAYVLWKEEKWIHRPSMLEVSAMLRNEHADVPIPKRPAFSTNKDEDEKKGKEMEEACSVNIQTISQLLPR